jgi:hypothetical protein
VRHGAELDDRSCFVYTADNVLNKLFISALTTVLRNIGGTCEQYRNPGPIKMKFRTNNHLGELPNVPKLIGIHLSQRSADREVYAAPRFIIYYNSVYLVTSYHFFNDPNSDRMGEPTL